MTDPDATIRVTPAEWLATDSALRDAASAAIDAFLGMLHSEKITAVLAAVAPLIRAAERERCALQCDGYANGSFGEEGPDATQAGIMTGAEWCAAAIRALGMSDG